MNSPNVVVVYVDDLGYGDLGCFGAEDIRTPNIDALALQGVRLEQCYSNSPVCSPARAALMTGRHPVAAGIDGILGGERYTEGLPLQPTVSGILKDHGYATGVFGKWHLGTDETSHPYRFGFDEFFGIRAGCVDYYSHIYYWGGKSNPTHDLWDGTSEIWMNGRYLTEAITERACEFIRDNARRPFFCYVPYNAPHYPMHAPQQYVDRFSDLAPARRIMAAMISAVDDGVGEIVQTLEELDCLENTIIVFSSDNGPSAESRNWLDGEEIAYHGGSAGGLRGHKGSLLEGGIRVPTLIHWPKVIEAGGVSTLVMQISDITPTLVGACVGPDVVESYDFDGDNCLGSIARREVNVERPMFWEYEGQYAVRHGNWKLLWNPRERLGGEKLDGAMLVDLSRDATESVNLSSSHPETFSRMYSLLQSWKREVEQFRRGWRAAV